MLFVFAVRRFCLGALLQLCSFLVDHAVYNFDFARSQTRTQASKVSLFARESSPQRVTLLPGADIKGWYELTAHDGRENIEIKIRIYLYRTIASAAPFIPCSTQQAVVILHLISPNPHDQTSAYTVPTQ